MTATLTGTPADLVATAMLGAPDMTAQGVDALDRCVIAILRARRAAEHDAERRRRAAHLPVRDIPAENATMRLFREAFGDTDGAALGAAILRISTAPTSTLSAEPGRTLNGARHTTPC